MGSQALSDHERNIRMSPLGKNKLSDFGQWANPLCLRRVVEKISRLATEYFRACGAVASVVSLV